MMDDLSVHLPSFIIIMLYTYMWSTARFLPFVFFLIIHCSPHYFKEVKISALALLKMVMHARSGGRLEVMGLMLGKIDGSTMVVMDTFALPVEGTETRVNAQAAAYEYMSTYIESAKQVCAMYRHMCSIRSTCNRDPIQDL